MDDFDDLMECMCDDMADLKQLLACGSAEVNRSKSKAVNHGNGKTRLTRREQHANAFQEAKRAVRKEDFEALAALVKTEKQANWHASDVGWCLLDEAVKAGSVAMVQWLLEMGANPNTLFLNDKPYAHRKRIVSGWYFSPLASAIKFKDASIISLMLAHGADLSLPVIWHDEDDNMTCRDVAEEDGLWPTIEALMIGQSLPIAQPSNTKRL